MGYKDSSQLHYDDPYLESRKSEMDAASGNNFFKMIGFDGGNFINQWKSGNMAKESAQDQVLHNQYIQNYNNSEQQREQNLTNDNQAKARGLTTTSSGGYSQTDPVTNQLTQAATDAGVSGASSLSGLAGLSQQPQNAPMNSLLSPNPTNQPVQNQVPNLLGNLNSIFSNPKTY